MLGELQSCLLDDLASGHFQEELDGVLALLANQVEFHSAILPMLGRILDQGPVLALEGLPHEAKVHASDALVAPLDGDGVDLGDLGGVSVAHIVLLVHMYVVRSNGSSGTDYPR